MGCNEDAFLELPASQFVRDVLEDLHRGLRSDPVSAQGTPFPGMQFLWDQSPLDHEDPIIHGNDGDHPEPELVVRSAGMRRLPG